MPFILNSSLNEGFYRIDQKDLTDWGISVGLDILGYSPVLAWAYLITCCIKNNCARAKIF